MKKIQKPIAVLLAVLMLFAMASCATEPPASSGDATPASSAGESSAESLADNSAPASDAVAAIKERGKVIMVTNAEFEPFEFKENDQIVGIDAEIAQKIAEKLEVELEITDIAFDSCVPSVQGGKADFAAAGMTITEDRLKNVDFSDNYFNASQMIIVGIDSDIKGREDLNGKVVGVQQGTTGDEYCTNEKKENDIEVAEVKRYRKGMDAVADLINGRVDAVVIDDFPADKLVEKNTDKIVKLEEPLTEEQYAIAVAKGSNLKDVIDEVLAELTESGEMDEIISKYIGE